MSRPIETKFVTADLTTPLTFDLVIGTDTGQGYSYKFIAAYFKAVSNITETVTVTFIRNNSAAVHTYLANSDALSGAQTSTFNPSGFFALKKGDTVRLEVTSASATVNGSATIDVQQVD